MSIEAMKLALEALERARGALAYVAVGNAIENPNLAKSTCSHGVFAVDKTLPALRQAIEQAEQAQPHCDDCGGFDPKCPLAKPAQQAQPVATGKEDLQVWAIPLGEGKGTFSWDQQDERFWTRMVPATVKQSLTVDPCVDGSCSCCWTHLDDKPEKAEQAQPVGHCDGHHNGPRCADPECWNDEQAQPVAWTEFVETACALIKAADAAAADRDYMLDSDDCISVLRGTWTAPMANDHPSVPPHHPLTDEQAEILIEDSDGRWHDGEFRIDGPDLMRLLKAAHGIKETK